jgi:predicted nucleotidyltransferase
MGGLARSRVLSPEQRSRIARRAAKARWARQQDVLQVSQIRTLVKTALDDAEARAYLFGSYASGQATADSDVDIMVIQKKPVKNWLDETSALRRRMQFGKSLDLVLEDEASFARWKNEYGTVAHEVAKKGIRLV